MGQSRPHRWCHRLRVAPCPEDGREPGEVSKLPLYIELERRRAQPSYVVAPSGGEVDFLARSPDGDEALIQVCADASAPETAQREIDALRSAAARHPRAALRLQTLAQQGLPTMPMEGIEALPAYEWMMKRDGAGA